MTTQISMPDGIQSITELQQTFNLSPLANEAIESCDSVDAAAKLLVEKEYFEDAVKVIVGLMSIRMSIWWDLLSVWLVKGGTPTSEENRAFQSLVDWVQSPTLGHRNAVIGVEPTIDDSHPLHPVCEAVRFAGWMETGSEDDAHWRSGDSERRASKLSALAIVMAWKTARVEQQTIGPKLLIQIGLDVAQGQLDWTLES